MHSGGPRTPEAHQLLWVDALKGLAIILVVCGHAWRGTWAAGVFDHIPVEVFFAVDDRIYAFHMPLFFVISGFFLISTLRRQDQGQFLKSRLMRLVWPLIIWSYIFFFSKVMAGSLINNPIDITWDVLLPIPGKWQFWFLWALFILHMGVSLLRPLLLSESLQRIALWGLMGLAIVMLLAGIPADVHYWTNSAVYFMPYLIAGMLLASYGMLHRTLGIAGLVGLVAALGVIAFQPLLPDGLIYNMITSLTICIGLVGGVSWIGTVLPGLTAVLAYFGQASMIIFLSHTLFSAPLRVVLLKSGVSDPSTHLILGALVGLLAPLALQVAIQRTGKPALFGV